MNKKIVVFNIFAIIILLSTTVFGAIDAGLKLTPNPVTVKAGEEFTVVLSLKDLKGITNGIDSMQGYIDVNENYVDNITFNSIVKDSSNKVKIGNETTTVYDVNETGADGVEDNGVFFNNQVQNHDCKIVIDLKNKITTENILTFKFKAKNNLSVNTYNDVVKFVAFEITEGTIAEGTDLSGSLTMKIVKDEPQPVNNATENKPKNNATTNNTPKNNASTNNTPKNNATTNNTPKNNATANNTPKNNASKNNASTNNASKNNPAKNTGTNKAADNTVANKDLPKTGVASVILKTIVVTAIAGFVVYVKYKKYKNI